MIVCVQRDLRIVFIRTEYWAVVPSMTPSWTTMESGWQRARLTGLSRYSMLWMARPNVTLVAKL